MGRPGDQCHLANRFTGPHYTQELGWLSLNALKHTQPARSKEIKAVGLIAGREQGLSARQGKPAGLMGALIKDTR
jgi:hypothetical protein